MVEGPPEDIDEQGGEEGRILSPDELDISESEHVEQLDEGRFVVSPDGPPNVGNRETNQETASSGTPEPTRNDDADDFTQQSETQQPTESPSQAGASGGNARPDRQPAPDRRAPRQERQAELTEETVHRWLRESFRERNSTYAFDVTATFEGQVSQRRMASNDVVTVFESLLLWYAQQVDSNTPVEEILGILLTEANVPVQYPPKSIHKLVKSAGLSPDDTIADLLEAVDDGAKL